jgi:hypothetical protein
MKKFVIIALTMFIACLSISAGTRGQSTTDQKIGERHRIVPLYALYKDGTPVISLDNKRLVFGCGGRVILFVPIYPSNRRKEV